MEEVTKFILEMYQIGFISSIIFILYVVIDFGIKLYGRVKAGKDTKFVLTNSGRVTFWLSIAIILSYLIH